MQVLEILDRSSLPPRGMPDYFDYMVLCDTPGIIRQRRSDPAAALGKGCSLTWSYVLNERTSTIVCRL